MTEWCHYLSEIIASFQYMTGEQYRITLTVLLMFVITIWKRSANLNQLDWFLLLLYLRTVLKKTSYVYLAFNTYHEILVQWDRVEG